MPVCHKCPRQREIDRLRRICGACAGASAHFGGDVHIDAAENPQTVLVRTDAEMLLASRTSAASRIDVADQATAELLKRVVAEFATLTDYEAPLVCRRLRGQENYVIAHEMGISPQVVWRRWTRLKKKNPIWAAIDNGMIGLRQGGRKPEKRPPPDRVQGELAL